MLKVTTTCICGSDLHMYDGFMPGMKSGDVVGHEFMGIIDDVGPEVTKFKKGNYLGRLFYLSCFINRHCGANKFVFSDYSSPHSFLRRLCR